MPKDFIWGPVSRPNAATGRDLWPLTPLKYFIEHTFPQTPVKVVLLSLIDDFGVAAIPPAFVTHEIPVITITPGSVGCRLAGFALNVDCL
jgi:hypothetical protein